MTVANSSPIALRPTGLEISLGAITNNVQKIRDLVAPAHVAVTVKANAYGHGMIPVAHALQDAGVPMLCCATPEEAISLRRNGITVAILLLSEPYIDAVRECYTHNVTFTVYSPEIIDALAAIATPEHKAHVHLKVDTGMNRVGCRVDDARAIAAQISHSESLVFEGIYTHFAFADDIEHPGTSAQLQKFRSVVSDLAAIGIAPSIVHAANSAGAIAHSDTRLSMVRIGLAAYGIYPSVKMRDMISLESAMSLRSSISYLKTIHSGETVSYGGHFTATSDTRIATIPIGYGDGVSRNLGLAGGAVLVHGIRCPVVGAVTMDQTMIDVTNVPAELGDRVTLLGADGGDFISPTEWADILGTIPYEIICAMSARLPRYY